MQKKNRLIKKTKKNCHSQTCGSDKASCKNGTETGFAYQRKEDRGGGPNQFLCKAEHEKDFLRVRDHRGLRRGQPEGRRRSLLLLRPLALQCPHLLPQWPGKGQLKDLIGLKIN